MGTGSLWPSKPIGNICVFLYFSYNKWCTKPHQEKSSISQFTPSQTAEAVEKLHSLSQQLHIICEDVTDLQEQLQYFVGVHQRLMDLSNDRYDPLDVESIQDSFAYIVSKTNNLRCWVVNYNERAGICINLFFNLATQSDSQTNLKIVQLSSKIAISTQHDSSLMIMCASLYASAGLHSI